MPLNDTRIRNARRKTKPYKLTDEKGLYLLVTPTGAKLWRYRYRIDGKENVHAMGEYGSAPDFETTEHAQARRDAGHFTLEEARQERIRARGLVKQGIHPKSARDTRKALEQAESANTVEAVGREWFERRQKHWNPTYAATIKGALERHVYPKIGALPVRSVRTPQIREILDSTPAITAINIRQWCSLIFGHAMMTERADGDPSAPLKGYIKRPDTKHRTPLSKDGIAAFARLHRPNCTKWAFARTSLSSS